jgi:hypothetical protein
VGTELARHLITSCTQEGDLVAEVYTTSDATLRTAVQLERDAVACLPHLPLARHIGERLRADLSRDQLSRLALRPCRPDQMHRGLADQQGRTALVVAALPPYGLVTGDEPGSRQSQAGCPACLSSVLSGGELRLEGFLLAAWRTLRPGGHVAVITTARHEQSRLVDPAPQIIRQARGLGFRYSQHVIAVRVPVLGDVLMVQAGPADLAQLRDVRSRALPPAARVHADVCLFTKPQMSTGSRKSRSAR